MQPRAQPVPQVPQVPQPVPVQPPVQPPVHLAHGPAKAPMFSPSSGAERLFEITEVPLRQAPCRVSFTFQMCARLRMHHANDFAAIYLSQ